jgi:hypothetical protein
MLVTLAVLNRGTDFNVLQPKNVEPMPVTLDVLNRGTVSNNGQD